MTSADLLARFEVTTSNVEIAGETFQIVHPRDAESLIDEAAFNRDERLPYWADVWPSSIALARTLMGTEGGRRRDGGSSVPPPSLLRPRTLLELGCGVGLVAVAALRAGFDVTASDYYDDALQFTRLNAVTNGLPEPKTMLLDWRNLPDAIPAFDVVVGSDVLYERPYGPVVARTIATTLAEKGRAYISDPGRVGSPVFFESLRDVGLRHVGATVVQVALHGRVSGIIVHEIAR